MYVSQEAIIEYFTNSYLVLEDIDADGNSDGERRTVAEQLASFTANSVEPKMIASPDSYT